MKWLFKENKEQNDLVLTIEKAQYDKQVSDLVDYLEAFQAMKTDVIAVKSDDHIYLLKTDDIIAIEVDGDYLDIMTCKSRFKTRQRLYKIKEKLATEQFIQVSKQSIININHLEMMEASFSGNMLAILTNKIKVIISRRYVKNLEKALGL
ncbi:LytTR family DNA-binding domain-containing protein [Streptococcus uberis]|uniref:LytTR family transcriptional regulator n=1 Tax=Streptococcus uberis TaxID=1349 RepID=A0A6L6G7F8_STRUB|nr:LytTR family DNA-binding domain-containing protein [Streptococcus uberis]MTB35242.1 LytTR family transcriptional regulator [Streptococcus uberis]MTB37187.1 LytTR family transcriptional regulator [Streptococcus uberis]MTB54848.1 LytTR family transcriptional regulator [Streptococcus uberis]MTB60310.1 LytTR family transcriptional regulator [Streptococcus uberis]MTB77859.1 LytTR family transcriptional regulator [Streptococcus uberis]